MTGKVRVATIWYGPGDAALELGFPGPKRAELIFAEEWKDETAPSFTGNEKDAIAAAERYCCENNITVNK